MLTVYTDTYFMKQALKEAQKAFDQGEVSNHCKGA